MDDENIGGNNNTLHPSAVKIEENSTGVVVGVIVAVLFFLCCVFGIYCVWKRKMATKHSSFNKLPNINGVKVCFNYKLLKFIYSRKAIKNEIYKLYLTFLSKFKTNWEIS